MFLSLFLHAFSVVADFCLAEFKEATLFFCVCVCLCVYLWVCCNWCLRKLWSDLYNTWNACLPCRLRFDWWNLQSKFFILMKFTIKILHKMLKFFIKINFDCWHFCIVSCTLTFDYQVPRVTFWLEFGSLLHCDKKTILRLSLILPQFFSNSRWQYVPMTLCLQTSELPDSVLNKLVVSFYNDDMCILR